MIENKIVYKCSNNHIRVISGNGKEVKCNICKEIMQPVGPEILTKESQ